MRLEAKWIEMFVEVFGLCGVAPGDACALLSETQTRPELPQLAELALLRIGAWSFHLVLPGRPLGVPAPVHLPGHPEILERCLPRAEDEAPVREAMRRLKAARLMHVASDTDQAH